MVKDKPLFLDIADEFTEFIEDYTLIGHNISYDIYVINNKYHLCQLEAPNNKLLDTVALSMKYFSKTEAPNHKLETFKNYFNLDIKSNRSLNDCYSTARLYQYCLNEINSSRPQLSNEKIKIMKIVEYIIKKW